MSSKSITFFLLVFVCCIMNCGGPSVETSIEEDVPTVIGLTSLQKMDREIEANPDKSELYEKRGDLYYELEGYDEAIADYKKVIAMDTARVEAHLKLAETYLEYDNSRLAILTLEAASYKYPENIDLVQKLGEYQIILRQNNDAFATLQRATKIDRFNPVSYYLMGINFEDIEDEEKAIRSFKLAVDKDSDFIPALMRLGLIYEAKEDPVALQYFDAAIAADPDYYSAYLAKGNVLGSQGKFNEAIAVFKEITDKSGEQQPSAFYNIGLAYFQMDSLDQSKKHFEITKTLDPTFGLAHLYLGQVAELQKDFESAKQHFNQATSFDNTRKRAEQALEALK